MTPKGAADRSAGDALRAATTRLRAAGFGAGDARPLLAHAMGIAPDRLTLHLRDEIGDDALLRFEAAIVARLAHQPVAQIIGRRMFWGHDFIVTRDTLDPRPETEVLLAEAIRLPFSNICDLGTGTGCILISALKAMPQAQGLGTDISIAALQVAGQNAAALGVADRAQLKQSDWLDRVTGMFDLITSNPPYIAADEMAHLSKDVFDYEPHLALTPGGDGLAPYRIIAQGAGAHLTVGGRILLEIGPTQGAAVAAMLGQNGFEAVQILPDFDGRDRVVSARKPPDFLPFAAKA